MGDDAGIISLLYRDQVIERDHLPIVRTHIELPEVAGLGAELPVGLHKYAIGAVVEVEIIHVLRSHINLQRGGDLAEGHSQALGFFAVDLHHKLRVSGGEGAEQAL